MSIAAMLAVIGFQFCFRIPFVYTASIGSIALLAHSLISSRNRAIWPELLLFGLWVLLLTIYAPSQAVAIMAVYAAARFLCEMVSLCISHVDKISGIFIEYSFGSAILLVSYSLMLEVRWWILVLALVALLCIQLLIYRRYDVLE